MNISTDESGYYAGYVTSSMMVFIYHLFIMILLQYMYILKFGRTLTSIPWGVVSDKIGRKPVLLSGLFFTALFSILFGFSTHIIMALLSRLLLGMMNPIIAITKTCVSEISSKKHEALGIIIQ
jgi:MFS family permease